VTVVRDGDPDPTTRIVGETGMHNKIRHKIANSPLGTKFFHRMTYTIWLNVMRTYKDKEVASLVMDINKECEFLIYPQEACRVYTLAQQQRDVEGDYAEVGVYKGSSAKLICEAKGDKHIHLFDTFEGLPEVDEIDKRFCKAMYSGGYQYTKDRLSGYSNVKIYKGLFPETGEPVKDRQFAFVHLDVDLYKSTKESLGFFYDRLVKGGIILTHDYGRSKGVTKAFDEFCEDKPEDPVRLPMTQCMLVKQ
jgi:hypothetical protein